jgi:hypothetical protein
VVGLTYLMPPFQVYGGCSAFTLYPGSHLPDGCNHGSEPEFLFARHLFCRYGCAIGIFQSFAWIGIRRRWWSALTANA